MSRQNVAVARRWVELFNERSDVDEFLSLHDPDVELQTPRGPRLAVTAKSATRFTAPFENVQPRLLPERFAAEGDIVVGLGTPRSGGSSQDKSVKRSRAQGPTGFATARSSRGSRLRVMPPRSKRRGWSNHRLAPAREPLGTTCRR